MITNEIKKITDETFELPLIIRSDEEGWIPPSIYGQLRYMKILVILNLSKTLDLN